jgi:adenine-specific DNA-methyltransferase
MDFRHPYLTGQIIAYIGNKRSLLPFLHRVFAALSGDGRKTVFSDPFSGSGAVSRLARVMGFAVLANDWEPYSFAINSCYLGVDAAELAGLFSERGGLDGVLAELSSLPPPLPEERYISRHFAPERTEAADWRRERLFYTAENAAVIDAVRNRIEEMYPGNPRDEIRSKEKAALLGPLLYEAATHTNTSGVFKACHKGFGGHGRDALSRIMARILPRAPVLIDSPVPSRVFCEDAQSFLSSHAADICYLDPPYAGHQYGSNYFMLNTIALWDKPEVSSDRSPDGRLKEKAGIRKDWTRTRSGFCYRSTAADAFRRAASAADCRFLCVSYSDEGIVSPEELADILSETGSLSVHAEDYVKYPGGKQSAGRTRRNLELLFVVDRDSRARGRGDLEAVLLKDRLSKLLQSSFHPARIRASFETRGSAILFAPSNGAAISLPMKGWHRFENPASAAAGLDMRDMEGLFSMLSPCRIGDAREELEVLLGLLRDEENSIDERLMGDALRALKSFAHRKYRGEFQKSLRALKTFAESRGVPERFRAGITRIEETAEKRFGGTPVNA